MNRLGVYGGTFDPPHVGHLFVATWALACGEIDELAVFPSAHHPLGKRPQADFDARLEMCRLTFGELRRTRVDALEASLDATGYTLTLLRALREQEPDRSLRLVVGQDILSQTGRWHAWDEVATLAPPLVVGRVGSAGAVEGPGAHVSIPNISSTAIRARLTAGQDVAGLVHREVSKRLAAHNPYRS